jgi:hypothetical protein
MDPISLKPKKRSDEDYGMLAMTSSPDDCCPQVYLSGDKELADLPKEGTITFKFCRKELTMRDGDDKPVRVTLKLEAILDAVEEASEDPEDDYEAEDMDAGEALDRKFKKAVGQEDDEEIED